MMNHIVNIMLGVFLFSVLIYTFWSVWDVLLDRWRNINERD